MAQSVAGRLGEVHAYGAGGNSAVELAVDEVAQPAEGVAQRDGRYKKVGSFPEADSAFTAIDKRPQDHADQTTVVGHSRYTNKAQPIGKLEREYDFKGVAEVIGKVIKNNIAEPGADNKAQNHGCSQVADLVPGNVEALFPFNPEQGQRVDDGKGHHIHQAVISQFEGAQFEKDRGYAAREVLPPAYH